jgi:hypothetical protein
MKLQTLVSATLLLALAPLSLASAQSSPQKTYVFETVDSYDTGHGGSVSLTGIVLGESAPRAIAFTSDTWYDPSIELLRSCERFSLMAMMKPGQYLLEVRAEPAAPMDYLLGCRLTRR